jgi:hypothetical protein
MSADIDSDTNFGLGMSCTHPFSGIADATIEAYILLSSPRYNL